MNLTGNILIINGRQKITECQKNPDKLRSLNTEIEISSVLNFRDAGNMITTDGKKIRDGIIFRSAKPDNISKKDILLLHDLNIKTIVDLRAPQEGGKKRKKVDNFDTVSLPLDFEKVTRERLIPLLKRKDAGEMIPEMILNLYNEILDGSVNVFGEVIKILLDPLRTPILIHCHAGKDRTGIICALIQMALNAETESIVDNYLESNKSIVPHYRKALAIRKILSFGFFPGDMISLAITVREKYILSVIDRVSTHYGGIEAYLEQSGQCNSDIKQLKEQYII